MNWLDILIVLPLVAGLIRGFMRGFVSEIIAIMVVILGVLGTRWSAPYFSSWIMQQFAWTKEVCDVVAYVLIFLGIAVVLTLLAKLLTRFLRSVHLGWANRLLGGILGTLKFALIVLIVVFVADRINRRFHWLDKAEVVKTSVVWPQAVKATDMLMDTAGNLTERP